MNSIVLERTYTYKSFGEFSFYLFFSLVKAEIKKEDKKPAEVKQEVKPKAEPVKEVKKPEVKAENKPIVNTPALAATPAKEVIKAKPE